MKTFLNKRPILLIITLAVSCLLDGGSIQNVAAQVKPKPTLSQLLLPKLPPRSNRTATNSKIQFLRPAIPPGTAPGGRRAGGGRRSSCATVNPKLTALVPVTEVAPNIQHVWGLTTVERPTFWFYMPYTQSDSYPTEFVLQDQEANLVYTTNVSLPEQPGIISVAIPSNIQALFFDQQYRWFLKVYCDGTKQSPPIYVEGVVRRVNLSPTVAQQLTRARPQQQAAIYAENGVWFQVLGTLAELHKNNPQDAAIQAAWKNLLTEVGLDEVADKQIRG
jgi:hypothetical protein